jgi:hypothetical protein
MKTITLLLSLLIAAPFAFGNIMPGDGELHFDGQWKSMTQGQVTLGTWTSTTTFDRKTNDDGTVVTMNDKVSVYLNGELINTEYEWVNFRYGKGNTFTTEGSDGLKGSGDCQQMLDGWQCGYRYVSNSGRGGESLFWNGKIVKRRGVDNGVYWRGQAKIGGDKGDDDKKDCGCDVDDDDKKDCGCDLDDDDKGHDDCGCDIGDDDKKDCGCDDKGHDDCGCDIDDDDKGHDDCGCDIGDDDKGVDHEGK